MFLPTRRIPLLAAAVAALSLSGAALAATNPPSNTSAPTISGTPVQGQVLRANPGTWTGSPTYTYRWKDCNSRGTSCVTVSGATAQTYTLAASDVGYRIRVVVWARNSAGRTSARSDATAAVTAAPAPDATPPSNPSNLAVTSTQQSSLAVSWSASSDDVGVAGYDLYRNGTKVGTTSGTSYTFGSLACGTSYTLAVDAYDAAGNVSGKVQLTKTTSACAATATAPASTAAPTVSGTAQVGKALSATTGSWSGTTPMTYAYQWLSCDSTGASCTSISGATASSYTLASADQGRTVRARVTATNSAGSASAQSQQTGAVQAAATSSGLNGLKVSGNHLVDGNGNLVRLHGVNYSGTEYACIQGWGVFDGPSDAAMVKALKSWNANIVHIGLNEDCILGINGVSSQYAGSNYMNAITSFVNLLHQNGLYAEVSLMWAAPGSQKALDHPQILDQDHSPAALAAIANAFKNDPNTIIGLQSEPHDISWACWKNGGSSCSVGYTALGMQGALNAIRNTGATNVVTASGIDWANTLDQWLQNKPSDSLGQVMAEAHVYGGNSCDTTSCFNSYYAPVAAQVPMIFGETGEDVNSSSCATTNISTFLGWADAHGVGYEPWTWDTWGNCGSLISDFNGTPANAYGSYVKSHFATLP